MTKTTTKLSGVITALITPFREGEIDIKSLQKLVRQQLDQGVSGFVINGTTGESPTLTRREVRELFEACKSEVAGQVPLIVGTGSNSTAATMEFSREVSSWRPDALLVVVPYYNKPPQRGLIRHFTEVARASEAPLYLYNVPARTACALDADTVVKLSAVKNIVGIKDATGDFEALEKIRSEAQDGFTLLSGDDISCVRYCSHGGAGVISVGSHLIASEMRECIEALDVDGYERKFAGLLKNLYVEANPIPVKMALFWMGIIESPELRSPLVDLDPKYHEDLRACLKNLGKI